MAATASDVSLVTSLWAPKADGTPYYLMDMLDYSGINFDSVDQPVELLVNGEVGAFTRPLVPNDDVVIRRQRQ